MKGVLLAVAVALAMPGMLAAGTPAIGVFFETGLMHYDPVEEVEFKIHFYMLTTEYWVTAVEFALHLPGDPAYPDYLAGGGIIPEYLELWGASYPPNWGGVTIGNIFRGISIGYWPPLTFFPTGLERLVSFRAETVVPCTQMWDYPLVVGPHPQTGQVLFVAYPQNEELEATGLTSHLCLKDVGVEEGSWGAIKSMYRR